MRGAEHNEAIRPSRLLPDTEPLTGKVHSPRSKRGGSHVHSRSSSNSRVATFTCSIHPALFVCGPPLCTRGALVRVSPTARRKGNNNGDGSTCCSARSHRCDSRLAPSCVHLSAPRVV